MPEKYIRNTSTDKEKNIGTNYIDLACSLLGGKILSCSDEFFAEADNLIKREKPVRDSSRFTDRGAWYDGWETRRHNQCYDWVIIKLAFAGTIDAFDIDTSYFNGNHPPSANVEGCHSPDKDPVPGDDTFWNEILPRVDLGPSASHYFKVQNSRQCYTHVKLNIYPDGGVARFRVYGNVRPIWPSDKTASIDLAFIGNGGKVVSCSDQHYGAKDNILLPGRGKDMSDGWETKRSRVPGHCDWAIVRLGAPGYLKDAEIDTAYFKGNFPDSVMLEGCFSDLEIPDDTTEWENILPQSKLGPDKQHYFRLKKTHWQFSHVKMTMYPDGGIKRLRLFGQLASSLTNNGVTNGHSVGSHNTPPSYEITAAPLTSDQFAAYGQVIEAFAESNLNSPFAMSITRGIRVTPANQGTARKYNHIAKAVNFRQSAMTQDGKLIAKAEQNICLYHCQPTTEFPFKVKLLERHLYSSQAFIPLSSGSDEGYLVIVCLNGQDDKPDLSTLRVFIGSSNQGINYHPGIWHHPMVALEQVTDFVCLVHESGVPEEDCEEVALDDNVTIKLPEPIDYNN